MGADEKEIADVLLPSLRDGTFPASGEILTTEVSAAGITSILNTVSRAKEELSEEIRRESRLQGDDVDSWIAQAKKLQDEIAKCKYVAREIVKEHEKGHGLLEGVNDAQKKLELLEHELDFSSALQRQLDDVRVKNESLNEAQRSLSHGHLDEAAASLALVKSEPTGLRSNQYHSVLEDRRRGLVNDTHKALEEVLDKRIAFGHADEHSWVDIMADSAVQGLSLVALLDAFDRLDTLESAISSLTKRFKEYVFRPLLSTKARGCSGVSATDGRLTLQMSSQPPPTGIVLDTVYTVLEYLRSRLPERIRAHIMAQILPETVSKIIKEWLDPIVPYDLDEISKLQDLSQRVKRLAELMVSYKWPFYQPLFHWIEQAPQIWLTKRKMSSLSGVRNAFANKRGPDRQVERTEREMITREGPPAPQEAPIVPSDPGNETPEDEDASGWDFDDEEEPKEEGKDVSVTADDGDDADAAWGWDEDGDGDESPGGPMKGPLKKGTTNGVHKTQSTEQELTLTEMYTITDLPDYLLEIIGRDMMDSQTVKDDAFSALHSASPSEGLQALPSLVLAMYRAMAPTYYSDSMASGNMHLYNDALYVAQKLREANVSSRSSLIDTSCLAMEKFGKAAYAREMDTQRTILGDLMDGAQGFVNCTQPPNASECETAVASAVERIRTIHQEWQPVLSHSALLQSLGSLLSSVVGKMIEDIEDMEDISEPQSQRLMSLCNQITALEDIFLPQDDLHLSAFNQGMEKLEQDVPRTFVYVPNWLKFQYLIDILDSSLVDIKWLWTEGSLGVDFTADEVTDLIRALFAESPQRKSAIQAIRQHQPTEHFG